MKIEFQQEHINIIKKAIDAFKLGRNLQVGESLKLIFEEVNTFYAFQKNIDYINNLVKALFEKEDYEIFSVEKSDFSELELSNILSCLEYFMRCRTMQFKIAFEELFRIQCWDLTWQQLEYLENSLKSFFEPKLFVNQYYGIGAEEAGKEAQIAYDIYCVIRQFLALKESDGWFENGTAFYSPLNLSQKVLPKIEGHEELLYKKYEIVETLRPLIKVFAEKKMYEQLWNTIHANIKLPSCSKSEIIFDENNNPIYVRCHECRK